MSERRWRASFDGQGLVEYSLVLIFVAMVVIVGLFALGPTVSDFFTRVSATLPS